MAMQHASTTTNLVNLTPHAISICLPDGGQISIPPSGQVARVATTREQVGCLNGIPIFITRAGEVTGLPEPTEGTIFIVSAVVRTHPAVAHRRDVCTPGGLVRDAEGRVLGCDGLDFNTTPSAVPVEA